jgi:hypothetical protein
MNQIQDVIRKQLGVKDLESLQIQNHIYGCFILMEDIADKSCTIEKNTFKFTDYTFDADKHFSQIGIRYGFLMDTKLIFNGYLPEYKETWLQAFNELYTMEKASEAVDHIEDTAIQIIRDLIAPDHAFFLHALQTGSLPQEWIHKVIAFLTDDKTDKTDKTTDVKLDKKRFSHTKRHTIVIAKPLGKTRRSMKLHGLKLGV